MIYLDLLSGRATGHGAISTRKRWPSPIRDEATAVAQAIALLHQHPDIAGFIVLFGDIQAASDAYLHERIITRATMAHKSSLASNAVGGRPMAQPTHNDGTQGEFARLQAAFKQRGHTLRQTHEAETMQPRYFVSAWGFCKPLVSLDDVRAFLQQIGGDHACS